MCESQHGSTLYVHGCAEICVCMTQICIVCLVAMSKFESSSHGSTLYFSSHEFFVSHMELCRIGRQPCCESFGTCIKMCYRKLVMFEKFRPLYLCLDTLPCSFKVYCLSFPSSHYTLGGISVIPKYHHHHVMRQVFPCFLQSIKVFPIEMTRKNHPLTVFPCFES